MLCMVNIKQFLVEKILPMLVGFLAIPSLPWIREKMFEWNMLGKEKKKKIGAWYGVNWQTILLSTYIAVFAFPFMLGFWQYRFELLKDIKSLGSLIVVGFTLVIFLHFQGPLVEKPRIFAVVIPPKEVNGKYIPDDGKLARKIEVPNAKEASLIFIRITNLGVNAYKNSGIIIDFQQMVEVIPSENAIYNKTAWKKDFYTFKSDYIFFSPTQNYQTIAAGNHIVLPIWIKPKYNCEGQILILFHCETRNGEASKKLDLIIK